MVITLSQGCYNLSWLQLTIPASSCKTKAVLVYVFALELDNNPDGCLFVFGRRLVLHCGLVTMYPLAAGGGGGGGGEHVSKA